MKISKFSEAELSEKFSTIVADRILMLLEKHIVYLYLSAGSLVKSYTEIAEKLSQSKHVDKLQIAQVDERYNSNPLHGNSNQRLILQESQLYEILKPKGVNFRFILNGNDAETEMLDYERFLTRAFENANVVHIALLGVGEDAHIAGIKPDKSEENFEKLFDSSHVVTIYDGEDFPGRITLTFTGLRKMDYVYVLMSGDKKRTAFDLITNTEHQTELNKYPAQILRNIENTNLMTDIE